METWVYAGALAARTRPQLQAELVKLTAQYEALLASHSRKRGRPNKDVAARKEKLHPERENLNYLLCRVCRVSYSRGQH